ncbi:MAG: hypothetical protein QG604_483 [Candidatus Dependentiae bacterium]|nr:hypothetical protein [Candidatus Dependentiae bacterium]
MNKHRILIFLSVVTLFSSPHIQPNTKKIATASLMVTALLGANAYVAHRKTTQAQKAHSATHTKITKKQWKEARANFRNACKAGGAAALVTALLALKAYYDAQATDNSVSQNLSGRSVKGLSTTRQAEHETVEAAAEIAAQVDALKKRTAEIEAQTAALEAAEKEKKAAEEQADAVPTTVATKSGEDTEAGVIAREAATTEEAPTAAEAKTKAQTAAKAAIWLTARAQELKLGTALHTANIAEIDRLVAEGVKLNATHLAAAKDEQTRRHLIDTHHLDINGTDAAGTTPLMQLSESARKHEPSSLLKEFLTQDGLVLDACNSKGETALTIAAQANNPFAVQALLQAGATLDDKTYNLLPQLIVAALNSSSPEGIAAAEDLLSEIDTSRSMEESLIHVAAHSSKPMEALDFCAKHGIPYDATLDAELPDLINQAIEKDNNAVAHFLISQETCDLNTCSARGFLPLITAIERRNDPLIKLCMDKGADLTQVDKNGTSPLMAAAAKNNGELVSFLLSNEAVQREINKTDFTMDESALFMGLRSPEITSMLLAAGANPNVTDNENASPLLRAIDLLSSGTSKLTILEKRVSVIKALIAAGAEKTTAVLQYFSRIESDIQKNFKLYGEAGAAALAELTQLLRS